MGDALDLCNATPWDISYPKLRAMKISFLVLAVCSSQVVMSSAQIASNDPPPANSILRLQSGTNFVLKSTRADTSWLLIPEYRSSLSTTSWTTVPFFTNTIQNGTNTTVFGGQYIPADSNVFFRTRQTDDRASLYDGPPPLIANTWGYAGFDVDAVTVTNMVTSLTTLGATNAGRWIVVLDVGVLTGSGRDQNGQLIGETKKFPSGLKNL